MAVAITQTANPAAAGTGTTITYSSQSIGTAAADRVVVLVVGTEQTNGVISSATIDYGDGAIAMSASTNPAQGAVGTRVFWKHAPTGTTATFAITFAASQTATTQKIAVYSATGAAEVASSSNGVADTDADPISSGAITIPTGGGCIAVCAMAATGVRTWTGITEDLDESVSTAFQFTTGTSTTAGTPTITVSGANNEDGTLAWVVLKPGHDIIIAGSSYAITGQNVTLTRNLPVAVDAGSYAITGQTVTLTRNLPLAVDAGSYALSGQAVVLTHAWAVPVAAGSYAISGQDVALDLVAGVNRAIVTWAEISFGVGANALSVTVDEGSYAISGQTVALTHAWIVSVDAGSYTVSGQDVALSHGLSVAVDAGSYAVSGQDVSLAHRWLMDAGSGSYLVSGQDVALTHAWMIDAAAGSYLLSGNDVELTHGAAPGFGGDELVVFKRRYWKRRVRR